MSINKLLQPQFNEFQDRCIQQKSDEILQCINELKANNMNLSAFSAFPLKQRLIRTFTKVYFNSSGCIVEVDDVLIQRILKSEKWKIAKECEKYEKKLERKINNELAGDDIESLTLNGNLWERSCVQVTGVSGRVLTFETKTIKNRTKYGDYFFQFPTRVKS